MAFQKVVTLKLSKIGRSASFLVHLMSINSTVKYDQAIYLLPVLDKKYRKIEPEQLQPKCATVGKMHTI